MSAQAAEEAVILLDAAGRYVGANAAALEILGITLTELLASRPDRFAMEATDEGDRVAFRSEWESDGSLPLVGTSGLKRADGTTIRVSYAIAPTATGFRARISHVEGSPTEPPTVLSVGEVLREWRTAERNLAELTPDTPDWARLQDEIDLLRKRYQEVFRSLTDSHAPGPGS